MPFPERFLDDLFARSPVADVVGRYVSLSSKGGRLWGLCPFHGEKTPSFSVSPDKNMFYCFGCGKGGSVVNFVMEIESLTFSEAVHVLAERAGMQVPEFNENREQSLRRERVLEANVVAARFFHNTLMEGGNPGAVYFENRGLTLKTCRHFGLGYAADRWDALIEHMLGLGFSKEELLMADLIAKNQKGGFYDRFRNRVIFPIIDTRGRVVGFGGRVLDDSIPKYLNSADTPAYSKSRNLFALNFAKKAGRLILAEGYMDVIALHQAGFDGAVASLGTSLTEEQARLMARFAKEIAIAYDSDEAGRKAVERALSIFDKVGVSARVLTLRGAKDPDEYISRFGRDAFLKQLDGSTAETDYRLEQMAVRYNLSETEQKAAFCAEAVGLAAGMPSAVERELTASRIAEISGLSREAVLADIARAVQRRQKNDRRDFNRAAVRPVQTRARTRGSREEYPRFARAEEEILSLLLQDTSLYDRVSDLPQFTEPVNRRIFEAVCQRLSEGAELSGLADDLEPAEMSRVAQLTLRPVDLTTAAQAISDARAILESPRAAELDLQALQQRYKETKGYGGTNE